MTTTPKGPVPLWRWGLWWLTLIPAITLFYVVLTPVWIGLRLAGWLAARRAQSSKGER